MSLNFLTTGSFVVSLLRTLSDFKTEKLVALKRAKIIILEEKSCGIFYINE